MKGSGVRRAPKRKNVSKGSRMPNPATKSPSLPWPPSYADSMPKGRGSG